MRRWRKIFPLGTCAVLVTLTFTGCPNRQRPVDTSQTILIETAEALAWAGRTVNAGAKASGDAAVERAVQRVRMGECEEGEDLGDCAARFVREEQAVWYRLASALEAAHNTMEAWEQANDAWRASDLRPPDWEAAVCAPVGTMVQGIVDLLERNGIVVPSRWRGVLERIEGLCELGVAIAEVVDPQQRVVADGGTP